MRTRCVAKRGAARPSARLFGVALLVGCNAVLGIDGQYRLVSDDDDTVGGGGQAGNASGGVGTSGGHHGLGGVGAPGGSAGTNAVGGLSNAGSASGGVGGDQVGAAGRVSSAGGNGGTLDMTGGEAGIAGEGGEAGVSAAGGTGGATATGGAGGRGGASGHGGASGNGGASGTGGTSGTGGSSATGGTGGSTGGTGGSTGGTGGSTGGTGVGGNAGIGGASSTVVIGPQQQQTIAGFGIADLWANAFTSSQADQLFDPSAGIGLSILRIGMDSTGGAISANTWADVTAASQRGVTTVIATVPSAPANCKTNGNVNDGGHLNASCYDSWATTIAAFAALVKSKTGVNLYGVSPENEPDFAACGASSPCNGDYPSMLFTANEMVTFVKTLGPKLAVLTPPVKLLSPETREWSHLWSNTSAPGSTNPLSGSGYDYGHALVNDATAWSLLDIVATHQYDTQVAMPWPSDVTQTKSVWMTEMSGEKWWPEQGPSSDIADGLVVAGWIHDALTNGNASAWLWWWYQALNTDDNEGLVLKNGTVAKRFYTLGNFSKFVRPGFVRVSIAGSVPSGLLLSGYYLGATAGIVVVGVNTGSAPVTLQATLAVGAVGSGYAFTPYVTSATDNLAQKTAVPYDRGTFALTFGADSVTTYVGGSGG